MTIQNSSIVYLAHGGGPLPLLGDPNHHEMIRILKKITTNIPKPSAIVMISAHWEESVVSITAAEQPRLIYDYFGFPPESYQISYPVRGYPELAEQIQELFLQQNIKAKLALERGFDHGVFVPLKIMYPQANIPTIQISLKANLDPQQHIQMGKVLAGLRNKNILVIGSGLSFHNLGQFFDPVTTMEKQLNQSFEDWLSRQLCSHELEEMQREKHLIAWKSAPGASFCHPREEHLLPLHVCYGVAGQAAKKSYHFNIFDKLVSCYLWN